MFRVILGWLIFLVPLFAASEEGYVLSKITNNSSPVVVLQKGELISAMPGSLLKPHLAFYLLEAIPQFKPERKVFCPGWSGRVPGVVHACWLKPGHRQVTLVGAIKESCNFYFYRAVSGLSPNDYFIYLSRKFGFPADVRANAIDGFLGDRLSRPLSLDEISRVMNRLYQRVQAGDVAARLVWDGMEQARFGTLSEIHRGFAAQNKFQLLGGKTGTFRAGGFSAGLVFIVVERVSDKEKFTLLYYRANLMGGKIPAKSLLSVLDKMKE